MSKRYIFPQQHGERKKAKLDVTISDHNFPLSQNPGTMKDGVQTSWGDDCDDEILLLASQACEDAYNDQNISELPEYSMCMQPTSTSTQLMSSIPSTSKAPFTFKKPTSSPMNLISSKLKNKCDRISSPLPGMSKVCKTNDVNISDDIIINDNMYKGQDAEQIYRQLFKLQEENAKLKSENGKLLEKCVTKEGEASILRTQLKTCQVAVDNARLDKVKAQERSQMEWNDKIAAVHNQLHDLRTQLDFKNLEIISIKEKCKMLESKKVKLTQVTIVGNDLSMSQRHNNNVHGERGSLTQHPHLPQQKKLKTVCSGVQTEDKSHFITLSTSKPKESSKLLPILPFIIEPTNEYCCILDYNEKLRQSVEPNKCRIYSTLHRLPTTPRIIKEKSRPKKHLNCIYESLSKMVGQNATMEDFIHVFNIAKELLQDVHCELETLSQRMTTAFQKEMDEKYIDVTSTMVVIEKLDLISGRVLYKDEQAILARRATTVIACVLEDSRHKDIFINLLQGDSRNEPVFMIIISKICTLLDNNTCAILYSGLLLSITFILKYLIPIKSLNKYIWHIIKSITLSRSMTFVTVEILKLLSELLHSDNSIKEVCCGAIIGNLKMDYDQGVLLYKPDSCVLQVILKQTETALKCIENQRLEKQAIDYTESLLLLYGSIDCQDSRQEKYRCECYLALMQVLVYGLTVCSNMLDIKNAECDIQAKILAACRTGVQMLYRCVSRDLEFCSQLGHNEGHLIQFSENLLAFKHPEAYSNMLSEITSTFQSSGEEQPITYHQQAWLNSFQNFTLAD